MLINTELIRDPNGHYNELSQYNPMTWSIGSFDKSANTFYPLVRPMKCRDYFNDVAYIYTAEDNIPITISRTYKQYGFEVFDLPYQMFRTQGGIHILLQNLCPEFQAHVEGPLVEFLEKHKAEQLPEFIFDEQDKTKCVVFIPDFYWRRTYRVSLLTQLIRMCNYPKDFSKEAENLPEWRHYQGYIAYFSHCTFHAPDTFKDVVAIVSPKANFNMSPLREEQLFCSIHNAGYSRSMEKIGFKNVIVLDDEDEYEAEWEDDEETV